MAVAQYLHDYTTNDLNNILMLTDLALTQPDSPAPDTLERVRALAKDALKQTRLAITALEHDDDADEHTIYQPTASDLEQQLFAVAEEQRTLLGTYGYQGSVLIGEHPFAHCSQAQATLALSLVREMFSNIVQHADPAIGIAEHHQVLAEQPRRHRRAVGFGNFLDQADRLPVAAHQAAHRRGALDTAQQVVFLRSQHAALEKMLRALSLDGPTGPGPRVIARAA